MTDRHRLGQREGDYSQCARSPWQYGHLRSDRSNHADFSARLEPATFRPTGIF